MKTLLIIMSVVLASYASSVSEDLFLKGHTCELQGQDSLANVFYGQACKEDPMSSSLLEMYSRTLLKVKDTASYIVNLRKAAEMRFKGKSWSKAFVDYRALFNITLSFLDGNAMSLAAFKDGIENNDSLKIKFANQLWAFLIKKTVSYGSPASLTLHIIETREQAFKEAASFKSSKKKCTLYFYKVVV